MHEECKAAILHCSLGDWVDSVMLDIFAAKIKYYISRLSYATLATWISICSSLVVLCKFLIPLDLYYLDAHEDETLYQPRFS